MAKKNLESVLSDLFGPLKPEKQLVKSGVPVDVRDDLAALFGPLQNGASQAEDLFGTMVDVSDPKNLVLATDWSNLGQVGRVGLINALSTMQSAQRDALLTRAATMMRSVAVRHGVTRLDNFYTQTGPTCQTMAMLNGVLAVGSDSIRARLVGNNIARFASTIYNALPERAGAVGGAKSPHDAISYLQQHGFPEMKIVDFSSNPIQLTNTLYQGKKFLVYSTGGNHVVSWVPSPKVDTLALMYRLDSLNSRPEPYSAEQFLSEWLRLAPGQQDVILVQVGNSVLGNK